MRSISLIAALTLMTPAVAQGRLFWQTYGATVAAPGGGCAWNMNQDYFVPRHCDTGRYGLFSECKSAHTLSPACKSLHPIYAAYCTPYGSWHYKRRDHVYSKYCGCTPWSHAYGKWRLDKCFKPCCLFHHGVGCRGKGCEELSCQANCSNDCFGKPAFVEGGHCDHCDTQDAGWLCNVEPIGGELLGSIAALPAGAGSGSSVMSTSMPAAAPAVPSTPPALPPKLNLTPTAGVGAGLAAPL